MKEKISKAYVPDAADSSVVEWALTAGVTLEEAALIQPAYGWMGPPPIPDDAVDITQTNLSVVFDDLRYSNFRLYTPAMSGDAPPVNIPVSHTYCGGMFCPTIIHPIMEVTLVRTDLQFIGTPASEYSSDLISGIDSIGDTTPLPNPSLSSGEFNSKRVVIQFDVEVTSPKFRIAAIPHGTSLIGYPVLSPNTVSLYATKGMDEFSIHSTGEFDAAYLDRYRSHRRGILFGSPVEPVTNMTIVTEINVGPGQTHHAQLLRFHVIEIPEPATGVLFAIGLIGLIAWRRNRP